MNLDQVFTMKKFYDAGVSLSESLFKTIPEIDDNKIKSLAQNRYEERLKLGICGTSEDDWIYARRKLGLVTPISNGVAPIKVEVGK